MFKSDLVNEDSSNRKRSSSLTEQGSRRAIRAVSGASRMESRPTELKPAMDEALMNFHMELTETCIDLMARYTFSTCSALPKSVGAGRPALIQDTLGLHSQRGSSKTIIDADSVFCLHSPKEWMSDSGELLRATLEACNLHSAPPPVSEVAIRVSARLVRPQIPPLFWGQNLYQLKTSPTRSHFCCSHRPSAYGILDLPETPEDFSAFLTTTCQEASSSNPQVKDSPSSTSNQGSHKPSPRQGKSLQPGPQQQKINKPSGDLGSIPGGFAPGFSHVEIVLDDATRRLVFSGISHLPCPCIPAPLHLRVSFHVMFRDEGHLWVPDRKPNPHHRKSTTNRMDGLRNHPTSDKLAMIELGPARRPYNNYYYYCCYCYYYYYCCYYYCYYYWYYYFCCCYYYYSCSYYCS
ncbi:hypothetical protein PR048_004850 [Dryococelus australis]|uniref:Uncharacterized protein n=1 Tax=Dryococelus australis TaxID=614101 RepID=A0ABQ9I7P2_9NEOP|nr:hypothetical protein PR048_004850 [Dryococelus australis]